MFRNVFLLLVFFVFLSSSAGFCHDANVILCGTFKGNGPIKLRYQLWSTNDRDIANLDLFNLVPIERDSFYVKIKIKSDVVNVTIVDEVSTVSLLGRQYLVDGDSIHMSIIQNDSGIISNISGTNTERYLCFNRIAQTAFVLREISDSNALMIHKLDSLRDIKVAELFQHRSVMGNDVFNMALADIYGEAGFRTIQYCFSGFMQLSLNHVYTNVSKDSSLFYSYLKREVPFDTSIIPTSEEYLKYLSAVVPCAVYLSNTSKALSFYENYKYIESSFSGNIKQKLLSRLFRNVTLYSYYSTGIEAATFRSCLLSSQKSSSFKHIQEFYNKLLRGNVLGATPYDFVLKRDSSDNVVKLSNFRGKVVLLDMWGYTCTGCYLFAKYFHSNVYNMLKSDTNFVVVSVLLEPSKSKVGKEQYIERLRGGLNPYTYSSYVNLYAASGEVEADKIYEYYSITGAPFIILIDKQGRIASSTLPLFTTNDSPNIILLKQTISNLLTL